MPVIPHLNCLCSILAAAAVYGVKPYVMGAYYCGVQAPEIKDNNVLVQARLRLVDKRPFICVQPPVNYLIMAGLVWDDFIKLLGLFYHIPLNQLRESDS